MSLSDHERMTMMIFTRRYWAFDRWGRSGRALPSALLDRGLVEYMAAIFSRDAAKITEEATVWRGIACDRPLFEHARVGATIDIGTGNYASASLNPDVAAMFADTGMRELLHERRYHYFLRIDLPIGFRAICIMGHTFYDAGRDREFGEVLLKPGSRATVVSEPLVGAPRLDGSLSRYLRVRAIVDDEPIIVERRSKRRGDSPRR